MREITSLNYQWYFKEQFEEKDIATSLDRTKYLEVNLPHTNKIVPLNYFDEKLSQIESTYKKIINIDEIKDLTYYLRFEGIGHYAKLYVNKAFVAEHKCGYTRWDIDITKYLAIGNNEITVYVNAKEINIPPFGNTIDYLTFGGIYREVYLIKTNKSHITDYYFTYKDVCTNHPKYSFTYLTSTTGDYEVELELHDGNKSILKTNQCEGTLKDIELWDIDNPKLYQLVVKLYQNKTLLDSVTTRVGFREATFKSDGFYLNQRKVKIRGLNRHQSYPYVGYAMPKSVQEEDAYLMKYQLGLNLTRCSHYPQSRFFLDKCDEIGLLVFEEIPGWQYVGDEAWQDIACDNVKKMITRDRHHPSIILWGTRINESGDYHEFYTLTNQIAKSLDPYRQTGGVRFIKNSELLEDVYTYNDFIHDGTNQALEIKSKVTDVNYPYLITEYGGHMFPTKTYDNEKRRLEHSLVHKRVVSEGEKRDGISGTIGWSFADYNTHKDFGSGDMICHHGVLDMFRNPKYAAYVYGCYRKEPLLEVTDIFNLGDYDKGVITKVCIYTNCDEVRMYHGEKLINSYYPNDSIDSRVIEVTDLIGNQLDSVLGENSKEIQNIKQVINDILENGGSNIHPNVTAKYTSEEIKYAWDYYGKYVCNWGKKPEDYHFVGLKNGQIVCRVDKGIQYLERLEVTTSREVLQTKDSYDVARITVKALTNLGNTVPYAFDVISIDTTSGLEVIGEKNIYLQSGIRSFWVKTKTRSGVEEVTVKSERFGEQKIKIIVKEV